MKIILIVLGSLIALVGFLVVKAPEKRVVKKEARFSTSLEQVWNQIRNIQGQTSWRKDLETIEMISQSPEVWVEISKQGITTKFQTIEIKEPNYWKMKVLEPEYLDAEWIGILEKDGNGTKVVFQESVRVSSIFYRVVSYLFFDVNQVMEVYLKDLSLALGETFDERKIKTTME
ncbi:MAG: SRPBCC family protein [Leptospira sp.]|nr:SRPBCC family protein [Leptospira sp.]